MFEPGTQVVCVDDKFPADIRDYMHALPVKGTTYTVRDIVPGWSFGCVEQPTVYIVELVNLPNEHGIEPGFLCSRFAEQDEVMLSESAGELVGVGADDEAWRGGGICRPKEF